MSKYYKIKGLKVRVSDHEPNYSMARIRGNNDVELYTKNIEGKKISLVSQINRFLKSPLAINRGIVKSDFNEILGRKKTTKLKEKYKLLDKWFNNPKDNKGLINDLKKSPNWFIPHDLNKKQKESWLKYLNKKLSQL